jgi:N-methylhydantoinase B/oxoprolinase/acetone carboxylase alpha subunit
MLSGLYLHREDPSLGEPFIYFDAFRGGVGALPTDDGADALIFWDGGDAPLIPVEVIESRFPIRIERHELRGEEYGPGKYRGGLGVIRDFRLLTDNVFMQTFSEQTLCPPRGLFGGHDGGVTRVYARPGTDGEELLPARISFYGPMHSGEAVRACVAGGAGYGEPLERDPERVCWEVLNEILTPEKAKEIYGVIIVVDANGDPAVDLRATEAYRSERRRA